MCGTGKYENTNPFESGMACSEFALRSLVARLVLLTDWCQEKYPDLLDHQQAIDFSFLEVPKHDSIWTKIEKSMGEEAPNNASHWTLDSYTPNDLIKLLTKAGCIKPIKIDMNELYKKSIQNEAYDKQK